MKRVYIDKGFGVSSTVLLCWTSEFEKNNRKSKKLTLTHQMAHRYL